VNKIDPERLAKAMAETRAAYAANKDRKDRVFGTAFDDVWWEQPLARKIKRISTGDIFMSVDYNGGYLSYFALKHGDQALKGEYKTLYVNAYPYEPIIVVGPALIYRGPSRRWTEEELHLIASFFQTRAELMRKRNIDFEREHGFQDMAEAKERSPMPRMSVVYDETLISSPRGHFAG